MMTLLFDFGGVLVDLDRERCVREFNAIGLDITKYLGAYRQAGPFSLIEQGKMSIPEFCNEIRQITGRLDTTDQAIVSAWESFLPGVPAERLDMLLKIKQHYPLNLLSNTNQIHWRQARDEFFAYQGHQVGDFFDHIFLSCEMGLEKPAPELYEAVIKELGVPASDILFFDDSEVNCEAARRCGMQSLLAPAGSQWFKYFDENGKLLLP